MLEGCNQWAPEQPGRGHRRRIPLAVPRHGHRGRDPGLLQVGSVGGSDAAHGAAGDPGPARPLRVRLLARRRNGSDADRHHFLAPARPASDHREPGLELDDLVILKAVNRGRTPEPGELSPIEAGIMKWTGFPALRRPIYEPGGIPDLLRGMCGDYRDNLADQELLAPPEMKRIGVRLWWIGWR